MNLINQQNIIIAIILIMLYICAIVLFAKEDNNNYRRYIPGFQENYAPLPDYSEHNLWDQQSIGPTHKDCYGLDKDSCLNYQNCGLCFKDGKAQCIPGDQYGPLFKEKCNMWMNTDYRDRHMFGESVTSLTRPGDYRYPDYETVWPSPQSIFTL